MTENPSPLPVHIRNGLRALVRYAVVMGFVGLLTGISFQESARKLTFETAGAGLHIEAIFTLALVHGHVFVMSVLMPLALGGALLLARHAGAAPVGPRAMAWLVWGYLPFAAASTALQLVKGYHFLLQVRGGATDLAVVNEAFLGGAHSVLRVALYGVIHSGLGVALGVFLVALWRSFGRRAGA